MFVYVIIMWLQGLGPGPCVCMYVCVFVRMNNHFVMDNFLKVKMYEYGKSESTAILVYQCYEMKNILHHNVDILML